MTRVAFVNGYVFNSDTEAFEKANIVCENGKVVSIDNPSIISSIF